MPIGLSSSNLFQKTLEVCTRAISGTMHPVSYSQVTKLAPAQCPALSMAGEFFLLISLVTALLPTYASVQSFEC